MPSIADQVETLEHDHAAALAKLDALQSANAALMSANTALQAENTALQASVEDMKQYVADTRAMADSLAQSALDMLRASRRPVGTPAEVIQFAPKNIETSTTLTREQIEAAITQHDSGDEQAKTDEQDAGNANALAEPPTPISVTDTLAIRPQFNVVSTLRPVNELPRTITVANHVNDLPIFLQRDTPFERANVLS